MFYWIPANQNIKNFNKHSAVDLVRFASSGISRTDLADQMGLTRAAVTLIVLDSSHKCNGLMLKEYLKRGSKSKAFSGTLIEFVRGRNGLSMGNSRKVRTFGKVLTNQTIGIFIGAALPGRVRMSEIKNRF